MSNTTPHLTKLAKHFSAYADILESGTKAEQEVGYALNLLVYAIRNGKTAELEECLAPLADAWLEESIAEDVRVDAYDALGAYRLTVLD